MTTHSCPIPGCLWKGRPTEIRSEHLMCYTHWMRVPVVLRRIIRAEARTRSQAYEQAVIEAIRTVTAKEVP